MADNRNRARTRAIRARMAATGEPWTAAARTHDAEHAASEQQPITAERDWATWARVRIITEHTSSAPDDPWPATGHTFQVGRELEMVQWGRAGRPVERDTWWTSTDIDGAHIIPDAKVEVLKVLREAPPTFAAAAMPAEQVVALLGPAAATWAGQGVLVISTARHLEVRAADGELLGLVDVDETNPDRQLRRLPAQPVQYRAVIIPSDYMPRSVPMPGGYVPERPGRTADGERMRWKTIPGVTAPETMRP